MSCLNLKKANKEFKFSSESEKEFNKLINRYPTKKALTLPALWIIQRQDGWISQEAMVYLSNKLELSPMDIYAVASFYTMFNLSQKGESHIKVCKTLSCQLRGSDELLEYIESNLKIEMGETREDLKFSLNEVECLGHCELAPTIQINDEFYTNLDIDKLKNILDKL